MQCLMSVNSTECRAFPTMNMHLRAWSTIRYFCKTDFNITIGKCVGSDWNLLCSVLIRHKTVSQWRQSLSAHSQLYSLSNYNKTVPDSGPGPLPNTIYLLPPSDWQMITVPQGLYLTQFTSCRLLTDRWLWCLIVDQGLYKTQFTSCHPLTNK